MTTGVEEPAGRSRRRRWRRARRWALSTTKAGVCAALVGVVAAVVPYAWVQLHARGHIYDESQVTGGEAGRADVVIVLGAEVQPSGAPSLFLQGRLDTAAALLAAGRAEVILVSGDAAGSSGNETRVMREYLTGVGIDPARVVADPYGLDTYDSCVRARQVYGVTRAFVVTQGYHLPRAVTLCRQAGIDADGVVARCDGCRPATLRNNRLREYFACTKAAWDAWRDVPPAVDSPASSVVTAAVTAATAAARGEMP